MFGCQLGGNLDPQCTWYMFSKIFQVYLPFSKQGLHRLTSSSLTGMLYLVFSILYFLQNWYNKMVYSLFLQFTILLCNLSLFLELFIKMAPVSAAQSKETDMRNWKIREIMIIRKLNNHFIWNNIVQQRKLKSMISKRRKNWRKLKSIDWKRHYKQEFIKSEKRPNVSSPKREPGFSSVQGLSYATDRVKKILSSSPRKKQEVVKLLSNQLSFTKEESHY